MTTATKKTFAELVAAEEAAKHNSDLKNLATALLSIKRTRFGLQAFMDALTEELHETEAEIDRLVALIERGHEVDVSKISAVYDKAHRPATKYETFRA